MFLPIGIKIVTNVPVRAAGRTYPAGSVGAVLAQPHSGNHSYRVKMADGVEASLIERKFKTFAQHQADGLTAELAELGGNDANGKVILCTIVGSRAYGLDHENSDTDTRGVYLADADKLWSLAGVPEQLEDRERDDVYWELRKFLLLALKANPNILEVLYTPIVINSTPLGDELREMRSCFLSKLIYQTYAGYAMAQFRKFKGKLGRGEPPKWKHAMHLVRLLIAGETALRTGVLPVEVNPDTRQRLLAIRRGEMTVDELDAWRQTLHHKFDESHSTSELPDRPDYSRINDFLIRARHAATRPTS